MRHLIVSALAVSLLAGSMTAAYAADRHDRGGRHERHWDNHRGRDHGQSRNNRRDYRGNVDQYRRSDNRRFDNRRFDGRRYDGRYDRKFDRRHFDSRFSRNYPSYRYGYKRIYGGRYYRPSGYRYYSWRRGDRLPFAYYAPRYIIRDYRPYRLYAPPRGYHWVRVGNDVVLAAITTGLVLSVVNNIFY